MKPLELNVGEEHDRVRFILKFFHGGWGGGYRFSSVTGDCFHLHEGDNGEEIAIAMQKTRIVLSRVAFHCSCGLRFILPGRNLEFGHAIALREEELAGLAIFQKL